MSGVWVFKNGVIRLVENPQAETSSRKKALVHLPSGQVVSSYSTLEQILTGLGWERYYGGDPDLFQFHKRSSIDLISLPETSPSSTPFTCTILSLKTPTSSMSETCSYMRVTHDHNIEVPNMSMRGRKIKIFKMGGVSREGDGDTRSQGQVAHAKCRNGIVDFT
ncbi:hypothetical protein GBA52_001206 [Prunus armeniaca]|nr:hypothetical protein GBA52_001206 [Prunus armeniaca]